jgi:hypothetical protein
MATKRVTKTFSVDPDLIAAIQPLAKKHGISLSQIIHDAFMEVYSVLLEVDKISSENPGGVPTYVAKTYLKDRISRTSGDASSVVDEYFPDPVKKKAKVAK